TLTAWAAGKFVPDRIASFINKSDLTSKVNHKTIIIPGYVAQISGELEEELPGWNIVVGQREAADIPAFLKSFQPITA
ncbi:MAG: acetyl-CoA decarbonylase/synthase complex subunit gamma, partial [Rubrobacteridae bacterium]|nr:acetyl-CoA decarbonylase/synthase complex subunit gamma [Rubrobacteridae bacterium]